MAIRTMDIQFTAAEGKGEVSGLISRPDSATHLLVLGHGASSNLRSPLMQAIADSLAKVGIATMRYNFPYSQHGGGRDSTEVCISTVRNAVAAVGEAVPDLPLLAGGQSFGGRMTSVAAAVEPLSSVRGLVFYGFPLHLAGKPSLKRAEHLKDVTVPMLFLTGTRDKLAQLQLLEPVVAGLGDRGKLYLIETADHGFKILKRSRQNPLDPLDEAAGVVAEWASHLN